MNDKIFLRRKKILVSYIILQLEIGIFGKDCKNLHKIGIEKNVLDEGQKLLSETCSYREIRLRNIRYLHFQRLK